MSKFINNFDLHLKSQFDSLIGLDEVGRGALAGPIVAVAFEFKKDISSYPSILNDSKKLSPQKRISLIPFLLEAQKQWGLGIVTQNEIDTIKIQKANFLAFERAIGMLQIQPNTLLLVDGNYHHWDYLKIKKINIIKGDQKSPSIMSASILAKIIRDYYMELLGKKYQNYQFEKHKGYGSESHRMLLKTLGTSALHRQSFKIKEKKL